MLGRFVSLTCTIHEDFFVLERVGLLGTKGIVKHAKLDNFWIHRGLLCIGIDKMTNITFKGIAHIN